MRLPVRGSSCRPMPSILFKLRVIKVITPEDTCTPNYCCSRSWSRSRRSARTSSAGYCTGTSLNRRLVTSQHDIGYQLSHPQLEHQVQDEKQEVQVGQYQPGWHRVEQKHEAQPNSVVRKVNREHLVPAFFMPRKLDAWLLLPSFCL